jgi:hypothetical protein
MISGKINLAQKKLQEKNKRKQSLRNAHSLPVFLLHFIIFLDKSMSL